MATPVARGEHVAAPTGGSIDYAVVGRGDTPSRVDRAAVRQLIGDLQVCELPLHTSVACTGAAVLTS